MGPFRIFQHPSCRKASEIEKGSLRRKLFRKKVSQSRKNCKGGPFSLAPVLHVTRTKKENPLWFSSLGQMVQFDARKCQRILVRSFELKKRHYNSRVSLHEVPTKTNEEENVLSQLEVLLLAFESLSIGKYLREGPVHILKCFLLMEGMKHQKERLFRSSYAFQIKD